MVSSVVPILNNVGEKYTPKNYHPVSLSFVASKAFEKLVNTWYVDLLKKCGLFYDFQYGFGSQLNADFVTIVSDTVVKALGLLELWHLTHSRLLIGLGMLDFSQI